MDRSALLPVVCVMARGPIKPKIKRIPGQKGLKGIQGIPIQPTEQQIKIAEGLAKGLTKKQALIEAGVSETNARSNSAELTGDPGVRKALKDALLKVNVGVDRIADVINEGLSATKVVSVKPFKIFPDFAERRQMARLYCEVEDLFPDKKLELPEGAGSLSVTIKRAAK